MDRENAWKSYNKTELKALNKLNSGYIDFLSKCKTERECVKEILKQAKAAGYQDLNTLIKKGQKLKAGDKVYQVNMEKSVVMY